MAGENESHGGGCRAMLVVGRPCLLRGRIGEWVVACGRGGVPESFVSFGAGRAARRGEF